MKQPNLQALQLTAHYLAFGILWILFSDWALAFVLDDPRLVTAWQNVKGSVFVVVTAAIFYALARRALAQHDKAMQRDALTGLLNRRMLPDAIKNQILLADGESHKVAVFVLDLDSFKTVNTTLGHDAGDAVLRSIATTLLRRFETRAVVGRVGADEFVVSLRDGFEEDKLEETAETILATVESEEVSNRRIRLASRVGAALYPDDACSPEKLLSFASTALEEAKRAGPGSFRFFNPQLAESADDYFKLLNDLHSAVDDGALSVVYQPQYRIANDTVTGVEALVRWKHPERGFISPARFIPLAEHHGLIHEITMFVLKRVDQELKQYGLIGPKVPRVSINLSAREFDTTSALEEVEECIAERAGESCYLQFEINETTVMRNVEAAISAMERLRNLGARFSIDDFGTGHSSLSMLKRLPLEEIKIDRSFIDDLPHDMNDVSITRTIIAMAASLDMRVVAEGVETGPQREFLRIAGCQEYQGYYGAPPLDIDRLAALFDSSCTSQRT